VSEQNRSPTSCRYAARGAAGERRISVANRRRLAELAQRARRRPCAQRVDGAWKRARPDSVVAVDPLRNERQQLHRISGATDAMYIPTAADVGTPCLSVTASNASGAVAVVVGADRPGAVGPALVQMGSPRTEARPARQQHNEVSWMSTGPCPEQRTTSHSLLEPPATTRSSAEDLPWSTANKGAVLRTGRAVTWQGVPEQCNCRARRPCTSRQHEYLLASTRPGLQRHLHSESRLTVSCRLRSTTGRRSQRDRERRHRQRTAVDMRRCSHFAANVRVGDRIHGSSRR